ncbi:hypothetical protein A4A49_55137 [Nicotiana attenuata]|uniref:Uncharacterized protein n=1 Tax=Nicotiana attenuata TaxID=49451 RepID=A0A314LBN7_NICAT|nr:hypothetical protein A4A49_55137 [Nicotiana attenuata]
MAESRKIKLSPLFFIVLFSFFIFYGQFVMAKSRGCGGMSWASPITRGVTKPKKLVDQKFEGIFSEDIKAKEDYGGEDDFDNFYRQHEDIPSPGVGH